MLLVRHSVKPSAIHGLGVFIMEPAKAGTVVWRFDPDFDSEITESFVNSLRPEDAEFVYHHAEYFPDRAVFRLGNDADIFMNHCDSPSLSDQGNEMVAARNLKEGTELTCDYREICVLGFEPNLLHRHAAE